MVQLLSIFVAGIALLVSLVEGSLPDLFSLGPRQEEKALAFTYPNSEGVDNGTSVIAERDPFGLKRQSCNAGYGYCSKRAALMALALPDRGAVRTAAALRDRRAVTTAAALRDRHEDDRVCCTNSACTARVEDGTTVYRTTTRAPTTTIYTEYYTYYYTVWWTYYYYYWTYYIDIDASVVTSSRTTTTSYLTVTATDSAAAESIFEEFTATATFTPRASETSLRSLMGETFYSTDSSIESPTEAPTETPTESTTESTTESPTYSPPDSPTDSPTDSPLTSPRTFGSPSITSNPSATGTGFGASGNAAVRGMKDRTLTTALAVGLVAGGLIMIF
ncbi:hypothetical protein DL771_010473 [Monosporascus sp. 5C6A]|nr:hypothetical protein DL771_010473 [Monosporascus sp. 5C6A]